MANVRKSFTLSASVLAAAGLLLSGCASTESTNESAAQNQVGTTEYGEGDITQFCPENDSKVAYAKGSNNTWTKIVLAELEDEASKCDTITEVVFADAQNDQQKSISDLNSLVAQGVAAIVVQPEFGAAQIPSIAAANAAGVGTVPLISDPGGQVGTDYPAMVGYDFDYFGETQVSWINDVLGGEGKVVFLGGIPGAASSQSFYAGVAKAMENYPGLEFAVEGVVDTNWDPGEKKRVMSALLAQHGRIDAVISDYTTTDTGVIEAYLEAGLELPALVGNASANINGCQWEEHKFDFMTLDGSTSVGRIALRQALAATLGIENPEPTTIKLPVFIDTANGKNPRCEPDLPADADLSANLTTEQLKALLG